MDNTQYILYSIIGSIGSGPYIKTLSPQTTTTNDQEAWYTTSMDEAESNCPQGFSVGTHPHPHH